MKYVKQIYNYMDIRCEKLFWFLMKLFLAGALDILILVTIILGSTKIYDEYLNGAERAAREIYDKIVIQTGQSQERLPMYIVDSDTDNAYNDGTKIVVFSGLINNHTQDEIAFVMAHEIAHGILDHANGIQLRQRLSNPQYKYNGVNDIIAMQEANADKMAAVYMMKAGYDICKGRQIFKKWKDVQGNGVGDQHPDYDYRYAELNINCGEK